MDIIVIIIHIFLLLFVPLLQGFEGIQGNYNFKIFIFPILAVSTGH